MTEEQNLLQRKRVQITAHHLIPRKRGGGGGRRSRRRGRGVGGTAQLLSRLTLIQIQDLILIIGAAEGRGDTAESANEVIKAE